MPYIPDKAREAIMTGGYVKTKGDINYSACLAVIDYWEYLRKTGQKIGYTELSEGIDALLDAAAELRRRILEPYEDGAIERNGDIIPDWLLAHVTPPPPEHPGFAEDKLRHTNIGETNG